MKTRRKWTDQELQTAEIEHGANGSDSYRMFIRAPEGHVAKWIDVPGWMVGDGSAVKLRQRAADILRDRLARSSQKTLFHES